MEHHSKCPKCGMKLKKIPYKKIDGSFFIEMYCEKCDISLIYYPDKNTVKFNSNTTL